MIKIIVAFPNFANAPSNMDVNSMDIPSFASNCFYCLLNSDNPVAHLIWLFAICSATEEAL
jgi:hypothetical protein